MLLRLTYNSLLPEHLYRIASLTKLKQEMEKQIEKAIRETLVISNPQSIHLAVKKILLLLDDTKKSYNHANNKHKQ
jgi:hypothetical protein